MSILKEILVSLLTVALSIIVAYAFRFWMYIVTIITTLLFPNLSTFYDNIGVNTWENLLAYPLYQGLVLSLITVPYFVLKRKMV